MMQPRRLRDDEVVEARDVYRHLQSGEWRPVPGNWVGLYARKFRPTYIHRRRAILVLGHGGHGKGELCKLLTELYGAECLSSSQAALPHIWPALHEASRYDFYGEPFANPEDAYAKRADHREMWRLLISLYNTPDKTTLSREILAQADVYDGMRCAEEFAASRHLFDYVVWVEATARVGTVDPTLTISRDVADLIIDNNGTLDDLRGAAVRLGERLGVA